MHSPCLQARVAVREIMETRILQMMHWFAQRSCRAKYVDLKRRLYVTTRGARVEARVPLGVQPRDHGRGAPASVVETRSRSPDSSHSREPGAWPLERHP